MKNIFLFLLFILVLPFQVKAEDATLPLRVVIVGGGPAGLSAAIELKLKGADVTIIEKREARTRAQTLFLLERSLELLEKWQVKPTEMNVMNLTDTKIGIVKISNLEEGLEKRVNELGIKKFTGEFLRFQGKDTKSIVFSQQGKEITRSYDILVAADGAHSQVRNQLGIECNLLGKVQGRSFMTFLESQKDVTITDPIKKNGFFIRKFGFPGKSLFFSQRIPGHNENEKISDQDLIELMKACDFKQEAELIKDNKALLGESFEVILQQAKTFSDEKMGSILVGDAAAVASYFQGKSVNFAFQEVVLAGDFFEKVKKHDKDAYSSFNQSMKQTTDELINDSKFLFFPEPAK